MATFDQAVRLADALDSELTRRQSDIALNVDYYRGKQPLKFATDEFRKYHGDRYRGFSDNWVQVVADSVIERLTNIGIQPYGAHEADTESWRVMLENGFEADSQLGFLGAVVGARSFILAWGNPDDEETPCVTFEDASQCIVAYEPGSRRKRRAGLKRWEDGERAYATLYLPGEVWKLQRPLQRRTKSSQEAQIDEVIDDWNLRETGDEPNPQPNPMGVVPLVELPNRPMLVGDPISDVSGVIAMQDAVNLLWAHLFTTSDSAAFPTRVLLGAERPVVPILDTLGQKVGERPVDLERLAADKIQIFEGEGAKIDEWSAANLAQYTDVIEVAVGHIAAQTRTPQHYLIGKMANLSGDALLAAETGLVKRAEEKQLWFGQALREAYSLIALAQGNAAKAKALLAGKVLWANAESRSQSQLSDSLLKDAQIGFPFEWLAAEKGLTPSEIADVVEMRKRDAEIDPVLSLATGLNGAVNGEPTNDRGSEGANTPPAVPSNG